VICLQAGFQQEGLAVDRRQGQTLLVAQVASPGSQGPVDPQDEQGQLLLVEAAQQLLSLFLLLN